ncbi:MAG: hypothetical protein HY591_05820 [Candidatus Omnitrophica bacterium]|nr:hypothetical protein [Candidatus Omnitrophota bacterium]
MDKIFKDLPRAKPDESVWLRVKEKIQAGDMAHDWAPSPIDIFRRFVFSFRSLAVAAGLLVMLGVGTVAHYNQDPSPAYLAYMMGASDAQDADEVSAGIERYFL